ncbi:MAG: hypothetical protein ACRKGH_06660 [Dehalogenimonas sp.]
MSSDKKRFGLTLISVGAFLYVLPHLLSLVRGFTLYGFDSSLFVFQLMSFIIALLIGAILIYFTAKSPLKVSRIALILVSLSLVYNLGFFLLNTYTYFQKSELMVNFILTLVGYTFVLGGSYIVFKNAKNTTDLSETSAG